MCTRSTYVSSERQRANATNSRPKTALGHRLLQILVDLVQETFRGQPLLIGTHEQRQIRDLLSAQGTPCEYHAIDSPHGHDAFLLSIDQVAAAIEPFLDRVAKA